LAKNASAFAANFQQDVKSAHALDASTARRAAAPAETIALQLSR
jgi:hypothetical protein